MRMWRVYLSYGSQGNQEKHIALDNRGTLRSDLDSSKHTGC